MSPNAQPHVPGLDSLVDELLVMRRDFVVEPERLCIHIGELNTYLLDGFIAGYRACQGVHGIEDERYLRFREWLRDVKEEFPTEGWRTKYLRDCDNDHVRAIRKFLDLVAEFHAMEQRGTC
jgi:hypothetical protein